MKIKKNHSVFVLNIQCAWFLYDVTSDFPEHVQVEGNTTTWLKMVDFILKLELKPSIKERILRAFLDLAILRALTKKHPMTGYEISHHFNEKLGIMISPNTIYTKLSTMERKAWITCASNKHGRAYDLTDKGQKVIEDINNITEEIRNHTKTLLN